MNTETEVLYNKERKYYELERPEMLGYVPDHAATLLDVGCGEGWFAKVAAEQKDLEAWGVDFNEQSIDVASGILHKALCGDINQLLTDIPDNYFDCIVFNDLLEHIMDPYKLLVDIKKKLSPEGVIVASIPNLRYFRVLGQLLLKKDFKYAKKGVLDETHMRFFTQKSINRMFEEAGYHVQTLDPLNKSSSFKPLLAQLFTLGIAGSDIAYTQFAVVAGMNKSIASGTL